jgi:hypothetical protein
MVRVSRLVGCVVLAGATLLFSGAMRGAASADNAAAERAVAVLPLAGGADYDDAVAPSPRQLRSLTDDLRGGIGAGKLLLVDAARVTNTSCGSADCARRAGLALGVRTVVFGTARLVTPIIWDVVASAVDVPSGRVVRRLSYSALGDYLVMRQGAHELGTCLAAAIRGAAPCHVTVEGAID